MRKLLVTLALTALLCAQEARANAFDGGGILSFDFGYRGTGFRNRGWGLGAGYERGLIDWASVKFSFSHMTLFTDGKHDDDSLLTTVGIGLNMRVYPFARGLSMLYIGYGLGTDNVTEEEAAQKTQEPAEETSDITDQAPIETDRLN